MKPYHVIRRALIAACLAFCLTAAASAASFGTGVVTASSLHLRAMPTTASASLLQAPRGAAVEVLADAADGWYQVTYNGVTGYMSAQYLTVTPNPTPEPAPEPAPLGNGAVTLSSGYLNIRSGPSTSHGKVGSIPNGTVVGLEAETDGWYQVTYRGVTGYVAGWYITPTDAEITATPTASATAEALINTAMEYLGCPYVYGAAGPNSFDCSGFTYYIFGLYGYNLTRTAASQCTYDGTLVSYADLMPGDIVCIRDLGSSQAATHVGIYIGDDQFIHASSSSSGAYVRISPIMGSSWYSVRFVGGKRILE